MKKTVQTSQDMIEEKVHFYSDGYKLDASFFWPEKANANPDAPVFIVCSGFTGLKHIHPERFARFFTKLGYPCFGFDYRGFYNSEGEKKLVRIEDQIEDIVHSVSYVASHKKTKGRKIILMGWGMAGGMVLEAARLAPDVKALISANGFFDAERVQKTLRGPKKWKEFKKWLDRERALEAQTGKRPDRDPFRIYPLDPVSEKYVDGVLRKSPGYNEHAMVKLNFADSLLQFAPERKVGDLIDTPLMIAHGDENALHPPTEAESLYQKYPGPKTLYWIPDAGHTEWMLDHNPIFQGLVQRIDAWVKSLN